MNDYFRYHFICPLEWGDFVIAELMQWDFEAFEQQQEHIFGFVQKQVDVDRLIDQLNHKYGEHGVISCPDFEFITGKNWNKIWESQFNPIAIDQFCYIRAPFHEPSTGYALEIIIHPKMSFGTGHHETTGLMISAMQHLALENSKVCDIGCGTGILAIAASKLGAHSCYAIDNDPNCIENTTENAKLNQISNISVSLEDIHFFKNDLAPFDLICSNITKNIHLDHFEVYKKLLKPKGILLLSGFFKEDQKALEDEAQNHGLIFIDQKDKNKWCLLKFKNA